MTAPKISVVVIVYNMRREAPRTLRSLTTSYQLDLSPDDYEVVVVDNGSSEPLEPSTVASFGSNFRHVYYDTASRSPCAALNQVVASVKSEYVMCLIDGARILSPGLMKHTLLASRLYPDCFVYSLGMHLGSKPQQYLALEGYSSETEDALLRSVEWEKNGYRLFEISSVALSSRNGFLSDLTESNCFALTRDNFFRLGGYDERFQAVGGGLANLDFFKKAQQDASLTPVMLLGEATFHQIHGGVTTNVPMHLHPGAEMAAEYQAIKGVPYEPCNRHPLFLGTLPPEARRFMQA